ncbi:hypothetical protein BDB00DRAFT_810188 [Zychaea mexicana]|uniref:uncharacterized protein n=1 Tax=Zychaea mexicana TaxID=64656 RepID=UPI0022FDE78E|nr:uncharacterized protein BDB00DRAFT_810188 [Zychaea mexicana]KAI9496365.1 hypothetical protein BDB00DRAFT_810188 [Zychaea mexicana]
MRDHLSDLEGFSVLRKYLEDSTNTPNLKDFAERNEEWLLNNTNAADFRRVWIKAFKEAAKRLKMKISKEEPDWLDLTVKKLKKLSEVSQGSPTSTSPRQTSTLTQSSKATSAPLMPDQVRAFKEKFDAMENGSKWKIGDSYVEDKMFQFGLTCTHEHACHSFVLDAEDEVWEKVFTKDELKVIKEHRLQQLPRLKEEVQDFFRLFKGKTDLKELRRVARAADEQFDVDWAQRMMIDLLVSYHYKVLDRIAAINSEKDLIIRVWKAIDYAFDDTDMTATRNDFACTATAERLNANRSISGKGMDAWVAAWKPNLLLIKQEIEYGCAEHCGFNNAIKKELFGKWLKLPKIMKDMFSRCCRKLDDDEDGIRRLKIVGFAHNHLRFQLLTMDSPAGYVCRVSKYKEYEVPLSATKIESQLIPILQLILKAKALVKANIVLLENNPGTDTNGDADEQGYFVHQHSSRPKLLLPAAMNPSSENKKKRKLESIVKN